MVESNDNGRGHETTDAHLKAIVMLVTLTLGLVLVGVLSMRMLLGYVVERDASRDTSPSPLAATRAPFTGPRLQVAPPKDMKQTKAAELAVLESYDWVDRERGTVRIPIERAIDLLADRGLPTRAGEQER